MSRVLNRPVLATAATLLLVVAFAGVACGGEMLEAGEMFVDWRLPASDGTTVTSSELAGKPYLIYFYPKADTPGCTREACELRDAWSELEELGLQVFGVSYDRPKANRAFAEKYRLPFLLLSDTERTLAQAVGATRLLIPVPKRISYLVGADSRVLESYPEVDAATHARQVLEDFRRLTGATP